MHRAAQRANLPQTPPRACGPCVRRREAARRSRAQPDEGLFLSVCPPASNGALCAGRPCAGESPASSPRQRAQPVAARLHRPPAPGRRPHRAKTPGARSALISLNKLEWSDEKTGSRSNRKRSAPQTARKAIDNQRLAKVEFSHARFVNGIKTTRVPSKKKTTFSHARFVNGIKTTALL